MAARKAAMTSPSNDRLMVASEFLTMSMRMASPSCSRVRTNLVPRPISVSTAGRDSIRSTVATVSSMSVRVSAGSASARASTIGFLAALVSSEVIMASAGVRSMAIPTAGYSKSTWLPTTEMAPSYAGLVIAWRSHSTKCASSASESTDQSRSSSI